MIVTCDSVIELNGEMVSGMELEVLDHRGRRLQGVIWCDTDTGEYEFYVYRNGNPILLPDGTLKTKKAKDESITVRKIDRSKK